MRAVIVQQPGGVDQLAIAEVPTPEPGRGELLVRVRAAAQGVGHRHLVHLGFEQKYRICREDHTGMQKFRLEAHPLLADDRLEGKRAVDDPSTALMARRFGVRAIRGLTDRLD